MRKTGFEFLISVIIIFCLSACSQTSGTTQDEINSSQGTVEFDVEDDVQTSETECESEDGEESRQDSYLELLEQIANGNVYFQKALEYQIAQPCDFIMHVDMFPATDVYEYRNIDTENLLTEWGELALEHMQNAYLVDVILDKYIREYGGKDIKYHIEDITAGKNEKFPQLKFCNITFLRVYGEDTKLSIIFNWYYEEIASVIIENQASEDNKELHTEEFAAYVGYAMEYKELLYSSHVEDEYWMFINPELKQESYYYRNVNPNEKEEADTNKACDTTGYYIADQVIDKYIRDYQGSDVMYKVTLLSKDKIENEERYQNILLIENGEETLQVEYEDNSWFVSIKINEKVQ